MMRILLSLLLVSFSIAIDARHQLAKRHQNDNLCDHPDCFLFAAEVAAGIDKTQNPCQDFFEYACGNWAKDMENPEEQPLIDNLVIQGKHTARRLKGILSSPVDNNEPEMMTKAKNMYRSCVFPDYSANLVDIKSELDAMGGWKIGSTETLGWNDVMNLMMTLMPMVDTVFPFKISIVSTLQNNNNSYVMVSPPTPKYIQQNFLPVSYSGSWLIYIAKELGLKMDVSQADKDATSMIQFKADLQQMIDPNAEATPGTIGQLNQITNSDWLPLFQKVFAGIKDFSLDDVIYLGDVGYFTKLAEYGSTPQGAKNVVNYIIFLEIFEMFNTMRNRLPPNISRVPFWRNLPIPAIDERWEKCIGQVSVCFVDALAWKYGQLYHQVDKERKLSSELTTLIADSMEARLQKLDWLDDPSRKQALNKLKHISRYYEYPMWIDDLQQLSTYYADLNIKDTIVMNDMSCNAHVRRNTLRDIVLPLQDKGWPSSPLEANAFYSPTQNNIKILEGILEKPMYAANRLRIMNFAELGYIIGHEITHGFDTSGVQYNAEGNNIPWLSKESQDKFQAKAQCLIDQYQNFVFKKEQLPGSQSEYRVNGTNTITENIADMGGLRLAYDAYQNFKAAKGAEVMPAILTERNYTEPQIFFLSFARSWCAKYSYSTDWSRSFDSDVHSPDKFRINGPLANFKEFSDAFGCPADSPMNRGKDSCQVW